MLFFVNTRHGVSDQLFSGSRKNTFPEMAFSDISRILVITFPLLLQLSLLNNSLGKLMEDSQNI